MIFNQNQKLYLRFSIKIWRKINENPSYQQIYLRFSLTTFALLFEILGDEVAEACWGEVGGGAMPKSGYELQMGEFWDSPQSRFISFVTNEISSKLFGYLMDFMELCDEDEHDNEFSDCFAFNH